jgi:hypothetical protein
LPRLPWPQIAEDRRYDAQRRDQVGHLRDTLGRPPIKQYRRDYARHRRNTEQKQLSTRKKQGKDRGERERGNDEGDPSLHARPPWHPEWQIFCGDRRSLIAGATA